MHREIQRGNFNIARIEGQGIFRPSHYFAKVALEAERSEAIGLP